MSLPVKANDRGIIVTLKEQIMRRVVSQSPQQRLVGTLSPRFQLSPPVKVKLGKGVKIYNGTKLARTFTKRQKQGVATKDKTGVFKVNKLRSIPRRMVSGVVPKWRSNLQQVLPEFALPSVKSKFKYC